MKIKITATTQPKKKPENEDLAFGKNFTDHMFLMDYTTDKGWHDPRIVPYGPIMMDPASTCFHYAQEIFEGMKAYGTADGKIQLFRPKANFARLNDSCARLVIPQVDEALLLAGLKELITIDKGWVPTVKDASLYIRPFIYASQVMLGVHPATNYTCCIIMSPSGAYYKGGLNPVKIQVETNYVRAVKGGMGMVKTGGNYAASLLAQQQAELAGCSQVLWLDGIHREYIEEVGAMNVFFKIGEEIITPALSGSILPGITRCSVIQILSTWGLPIVERQISINELIEAAKSGELKEAWGTGTAAVISPMGVLRYLGEDITINQNQIGATCQRLYDALTDIQWGRTADTFGWIEPCCEL